MENKMEEVLKELEELKKKLENQNEESTLEKAKKINEEMAKNSKKNMKDSYDKTSEALERLREDARCLVAVSDNGCIVMGTRAETLAMLSTLVEHLLKKNVVEEKDIRFAVESGIKGIERARKEVFGEDINEQIDKMMNEIFGE